MAYTATLAGGRTTTRLRRICRDCNRARRRAYYPTPQERKRRWADGRSPEEWARDLRQMGALARGYMPGWQEAFERCLHLVQLNFPTLSADEILGHAPPQGADNDLWVTTARRMVAYLLNTAARLPDDVAAPALRMTKNGYVGTCARVRAEIALHRDEHGRLRARNSALRQEIVELMQAYRDEAESGRARAS